MATKAAALIALALAAGFAGLAAPRSSDVTQSGRLIPTAQAQRRLRSLRARLRGEKFPPGIVETNGRIEATQVDVSSKYAGRLSKVSVEEGSTVVKGQVLAVISSPELDAQLRAAQADVQRAQNALAAAEAEIKTRQAALTYAKADYDRGAELVKRGTISRQTFDQRTRSYEAAASAVNSATAQRDAARSTVMNAEAQVERVQSMLHDLELTSPRSGRVHYQLAREGEVVAAGAAVLTLLDLSDVYMTIFLPAADAGKLGIGDQARMILDPIPQYVIPASVSFVAAEAQFTPKTVETKNEREKLMFRVKLKVDPAVLQKYQSRIKVGVRGMGFVRTNASVAWPKDLQVTLPTQ